MLAQTSPVMKKATVRLMELSADEKARQLYEARLKEQRDNYARTYGAVKSAVKSREFEFAKVLLADDVPIEKIIAYTGFTQDEIELIRDTEDFEELI